jgi:hypothetical protein
MLYPIELRGRAKTLYHFSGCFRPSGAMCAAYRDPGAYAPGFILHSSPSRYVFAAALLSSQGRLSQVLVCLVDPVRSRRSEDVEVDCIHHRFRFVRHVGGDSQDFAGIDHDDATVDPELQCAFQDVGELLVVMAVLGDDAALLEQDAGDHDFLADYELALEQGVQVFEFDCAPWDVLRLGFFCGSAASRSYGCAKGDGLAAGRLWFCGFRFRHGFPFRLFQGFFIHDPIECSIAWPLFAGPASAHKS